MDGWMARLASLREAQVEVSKFDKLGLECPKKRSWKFIEDMP